MSRFPKVRVVYLGGALLLSVIVSHAQFEGVVETKNLTRDEMGKPNEFVMTMWIKKDMVKVTNSAIGSAPGTTMIYRNDKKAMWILNDESKTYYSIPQETSGREPRPPQTNPAVGKLGIKRTRKVRRILGYPAEQILVTRDGQRTEIWGTKKLRDLSVTLSNALGDRQSGAGDGLTGEITKMGLFPLTSSTVIRGKVAESQEVTKIEPRTLTPEVFEVPPTYMEERVDPMLRGLKEQRQK